jgi:hypothetical protein
MILPQNDSQTQGCVQNLHILATRINRLLQWILEHSSFWLYNLDGHQSHLGYKNVLNLHHGNILKFLGTTDNSFQLSLVHDTIWSQYSYETAGSWTPRLLWTKTYMTLQIEASSLSSFPTAYSMLAIWNRVLDNEEGYTFWIQSRPWKSLI